MPHPDFHSFLATWEDTPERNKDAFLQLSGQLIGRCGVALDFIGRPGPAWSFRAACAEEPAQGLFAMIDVMEDSPRWLSVSLYADMISDPEARGDVVPGGLLGKDAVCFDILEWDDELIRYVEARLDEACRNAAAECGRHG